MSMSVFDIQVSWFLKLTDPTNGHKNTGTFGSLLECIWSGGKDGGIKEKVEKIRKTTDAEPTNCHLARYIQASVK